MIAKLLKMEGIQQRTKWTIPAIPEKSSPDAITLTSDLIKWTIPARQKFPRGQRFLLGDRIEKQTLEILELLISANLSE